MIGPLLHLTTPAQWRAALAVGVIAPPSLTQVGFVHLSTPDQVALPADRLFHGRRDLVLLVLDPARIGVEVRLEPGRPTDPPQMRFPHAYGPVPTSAVTAVLPYRPCPDGGFPTPPPPPTDRGVRATLFEPSLLRRVATSELPVTGGVAVLTASVPASHRHNQLLIDGAVDAAQLVIDADRTLGGAGLRHRHALLLGSHLAGTAAELAEHGWDVERGVAMAGPAIATRPDDRVECVDLEALRPMWDARWRRHHPGITDTTVTQLTDRYRAEEPVVDLRYLAVLDDGEVVAGCPLKIDGGTAQLGSLNTDPAHRGRGHGDALVATARALARDAGCDLVVIDAYADDWPRHWYARRGFVEVGESWTVGHAT